ncbi:MAG TPA: glycosyltransferase 87 family protein [Solirubrobacteraceae bacterium]|nr:glycosyltransferase 87 family protein [Solirubrobacteraceae bacterium]
MNTLPDVRGKRPGVDRRHEATAPQNVQSATAVPVTPEGVISPGARQLPLRARVWEWGASLDTRWRYPLVIFVATRVLYMALAGIDHFVRAGANGHHWSLGRELSNWDGAWYVAVAVHGYAHHLDLTHWNTLGFLPLYPMLMWLLGHGFSMSPVLSGMIISTITGAGATVLIARLVERWWGKDAVRRAILFFCLFPGSIVFSMVYTEGLLLVLVAGSLLALERRRWALAGLLAGLSTAVGPVAMGIIPALAVASWLEIRQRGWRDRDALRSLAAPILSPLGAIGFAIFLWVWTGTPFASYTTQKVDWKETTTPLAIPRGAVTLTKQALGLEGPPHPNVDLNILVGLLGTVFLIWGLRMLWRQRARVSAAALVWTGALAFMTLTSNSTPPNARMLICAFPVIVVVGASLRGRAYRRLITSSTLLLLVMSMITFVSTGLRP